MLDIALFEVKTKLRRVSTYVYLVLFASLAALWMAAAGGAFSSASITFGAEKVFINAPYALAQTITVLGLLGMVTVAAFMGRAIQQDFEHETHHFFFTSPITRTQYLVGRFVGAAAVLLFIFSGIALGAFIGTNWPGVDATRVGPWSLAAVVKPYLVMLLPNMLVLGACFFALAAFTRRMLPVYVAGIVVLIGWLIAQRLLQDIDNRTVAALIDPLGSTALGLVTRYWSPAEKNTLLIPIADEVLWNRALWLAFGAAVAAATLARFRMSASASRAGERADAPEPGTGSFFTEQKKSTSPVDMSGRGYLATLPGMVRLYVRETLRNPYFLAIAASGALFVFGNAKVIGSRFGTNTYPVTYEVLDFASGSFVLFMLIITALYAGELVWRERDARMAGIVDSTPAPTWLSFAGKLFTLMALQAVLQVVVMACGVLVQLFNGYTKLELWQYIHRLFLLQLPDYWILAALALAVHALVNHKYLGHFLIILYYIAETMAEAFGYDNRLYRYGSGPSVTYSDMNGYGHFLGPLRWFQLYWGAGAVLLLVAARLFWVRGTDTAWRARLGIARSRFTRPVMAVSAAAAAVFVATGAWIYYNTHVLNPYRNEFARESLRADYERRYKALAEKPQPKITGVKVAVDIRPEEHRVRFQGTYAMRNKSGEAIPELYVNLPENAEIRALEGSIGLKPVETRRDLNWLRYALERPLAPGEALELRFDIDYPPRGFSNSGAHGLVVDNGTFVNSALLPSFGYNDRLELAQDNDRRKHGLPPRERMPDLDHAPSRQRNYISRDGDWIDFEATISTAPDQIALAPGYLQREWNEGGRRHFHYKMDAPILNFYSFLSARYAVKKDRWVGPDGKDVAIEIYYHPGHEYNLEGMIAGVKDSLDYFTRNFSPYQHRQVRILEFPRYASFAQSFPNTIPYSESIGFIARVDPSDPKDLDYPYYVTAHEVAHQWWAHQVIGANVQGATVMSETLSQYAALMVMKKKYGDAKMKRFLKYELDGYLRGRGAERKKELPLYRNENQQYIHYRKGSIATYALQDAIGEEAVNRALAAYIRKVGFQEPPYTTSRELLAELRAVTPAEFQPLLSDLFETITLWENRALSATWREKSPGRYEVTLEVSAKKLRADDQGRQTEVPMDDLVDIGVLGADDAPLYLKKHRIATGETTLTIEVDGRPVKAGIDPVVKLIDRRPDDNVVPVGAAS